jgi:hypothetical protein
MFGRTRRAHAGGFASPILSIQALPIRLADSFKAPFGLPPGAVEIRDRVAERAIRADA